MIPFRPRSRIAIDRTGAQAWRWRSDCRHLRSDAWAKPKVPLPKPRPIARNVVPKHAVATTPPPHRPRRARAAAPRSGRAGTRPATRQHAALPPPRKQVAPRRDGRDVIDLAGRQGRAGKRHRAGAQAQAGGCDAGAGRDIRSGRAQARRMDHPAQRQQRRLGRTLSRLHLRQSELAVADLPAPAHRGGAVGRPSRRRHGAGRGSRTNRRSRPRANSRWRRR